MLNVVTDSEASAEELSIPYSSFTFSCEFDEETKLPLFPGSAIRGALGKALKQSVCVVRQVPCKDCALNGTCLYPALFEPKRNVADCQLPGSTVIQPYILRLPSFNYIKEKANQRTFTFEVLLFGKYTKIFPQIFYAVRLMGENGIGKNSQNERGSFSIKEVLAESQVVYDAATERLIAPAEQTLSVPTSINFKGSYKSLRCELQTPLRIRHSRRLLQKISFEELLYASVRRLNQLSASYGNMGAIEISPLRDQVADVKVQSDKTSWVDWTRYSFRQQTRMKLGGLLGEVVFSNVPEGVMPLLSAVEKFNIGKQSTFGLGKICFELME